MLKYEFTFSIPLMMKWWTSENVFKLFIIITKSSKSLKIRRTPMPKCDFNKISLLLYRNRISTLVFFVNMLHTFRAPFPNNTYGELLLTPPYSSPSLLFTKIYLNSAELPESFQDWRSFMWYYPSPFFGPVFLPLRGGRPRDNYQGVLC